MERKKRPPININELKGEGKPEAESGALSYIARDRKPGGRSSTRRGSSNINWVQVLLSCIISLCLAAFIILQVAPSKGSVSNLAVKTNELVATTNEVSDVAASVSNKLDNEILRIDNVINRMPDYAYASDFEAYSRQISSLVAGHNGFSSEIGRLAEELYLLQNKIIELEGKIWRLEH